MTTAKKSPEELRSQRWYGPFDMRGISHRARSRQMGFSSEDFAGKPKIGILNTWSDMTPCNGHLRELAEKVKAGIWEAGGFPVEVPVFSASENTFRPTAMMFRNPQRANTPSPCRRKPLSRFWFIRPCGKRA